MTLGPVGQVLARKLTHSFAPQSLEVIDESHRHAGHAGASPAGESHFRIDIVAEAFAGKSRLERHRMVNEALASELKSRVHALAIRAKAPDDGLRFVFIPADDARLVALLGEAGLPGDDLAGTARKFFAFTTAANEIVAAGGIEMRGSDALLRSIAVADEFRKFGLGRAMVRKLLAELKREGATAAYLLTQSADGFFAKLGFSAIDRARVPSAIAETTQFAGPRCASATAMMLKLPHSHTP